MSDKKNLPASLDENFQKMEHLIESFLRTVYEWNSIDPLEVALFLNILAGKQLGTALQSSVGIDQDEIDNIATTQVDRYWETGTVDTQTFVGELIGLHRVAGTKMLKLFIMTEDLKTVVDTGPPIPYDELE